MRQRMGGESATFAAHDPRKICANGMDQHRSTRELTSSETMQRRSPPMRAAWLMAATLSAGLSLPPCASAEPSSMQQAAAGELLAKAAAKPARKKSRRPPPAAPAAPAKILTRAEILSHDPAV